MTNALVSEAGQEKESALDREINTKLCLALQTTVNKDELDIN